MTHRSPVHIRFADIDAMGHVNNAIYFNYFEQARMAWFQELIGEDWDWKSNGVLLAHNEIDYKLPLMLNDKASIETTVKEIGTKSLTMRFRVMVQKGEQEIEIAVGACVLVCFDHKTQRTIEVPEVWKTRLVVS